MLDPSDAFSARILIVDDQLSNIRLIEYTLRRAGYGQVTSTLEPAMVASLQCEQHYDLIILDLQMPVMNGFQVLESLDEIAMDRPAILVMSADPTQAVRAVEMGADSFLSKPCVLPEVVARVHLLLDPSVVRVA